MTERPRVPENTPNNALDNLIELTEELSSQIRHANTIAKEEIGRLVKEHDQIALNQVKAHQILVNASEQLRSFREGQVNGNFQDEHSRELIIRLEKIIIEAEESFAAADQRLADLFNQKEVGDKIHEEALKGREVELKLENDVQECLRLIDQIVELKGQITKRKVEIENKVKEATDASYACDKLLTSTFDRKDPVEWRDIARNLERDMGNERKNFDSDIAQAQSFRKSLGWFKGNLKGRIDRILNELPELFKDKTRKKEEVSRLDQESREGHNQIEELTKKLKGLDHGFVYDKERYGAGEAIGIIGGEALQKVNKYCRDKLGKSINELSRY